MTKEVSQQFPSVTVIEASSYLCVCSLRVLFFFLFLALLSSLDVNPRLCFISLVMEHRSDLHLCLCQKHTSRRFLSFPAYRRSSAVEVDASSVGRLCSTGSEFFSGISRRSFTRVTIYLRRASLLSDKQLIVSLDGGSSFSSVMAAF